MELKSSVCLLPFSDSVKECEICTSIRLFLPNWADVCHNGVAHRESGNGGDDLRVWRVTLDILNKQWMRKMC
jgi:hypothetical protein